MGQTKPKSLDNSEVDTQAKEEAVAKQKKSNRGPRSRGKAYKQAKAKVDTNKIYSLSQAVGIIKDTTFTKFDSTVELHMVVNKEGISAQVDLPFSTGKQKRVEVADENTIAKLEKGKVDYDVLLATSDMMPKLVKYARILGPKGLMPNPKNGTVIKSPKDAEKFSGNSMTIKTERKAPLIHTVAGKTSMKEKDLEQNINSIFDAIGRRKIKKAYLSSTMSPSVKVAVD